MMALAMTPNQMHAETVTAPSWNSEPAGYPVGGWLVKAEAPAWNRGTDSKIADFCPDFKRAFQPGRVRLLNWRA